MDKIKVSKVENVQILRRGIPLAGTLHLTSHHLIFSITPEDPTARAKEIWITYPIIAHAIFRPSPPASGLASSIRLRCRDFTFVTFHFGDESKARDAYESIKSLTCKVGRVDKLYAFSYRPQQPEKDFNGWELYDPKAEWKRQGISPKDSDKGWRISNLNADYKFSPTYPALLLSPNGISDNVLHYAGRFRSRARIPVLTYLHPFNRCSITRSSQPLTGLRGSRSVQDEKLVAAIFASSQPDTERPGHVSSSTSALSRSPSFSHDSLEGSSSAPALIEPEAVEDALIGNETTIPLQKAPRVYGSQQDNLIVDARPTVNAFAMQAVGLGTESKENYHFGTRMFLGIDNIHVMRDSLAKVIEAIKDADITPLPPNRELLAKSGWLKHITGLLEGANLIARQISLQHSHVLIHCSDGWDRTSQLSALSQICLDPYFRTLDGFIVLVEKDWLSFGHMFRHRAGLLGSEKWFVTQNDGGSSNRDGQQSASSSPFGGGSAGSKALENAFLSAKGFFNKDNNSRENVGADSDGEFDGSSQSKRGTSSSPSKSSGHDSEATKPKETSPVFHQFLDATYQLLQQYPTRFEFNERFLRRLLYHLYSCQYGTFLYNNERERVEAHAKDRTRSVWDYFLARRDMFLNENYEDSTYDEKQRDDHRLVFPRIDEVKWWHEVFGRTDEEMNGSPTPPLHHGMNQRPLSSVRTAAPGTSGEKASGSGRVPVSTSMKENENGVNSLIDGVRELGLPVTGTGDDVGQDVELR